MFSSNRLAFGVGFDRVVVDAIGFQISTPFLPIIRCNTSAGISDNVCMVQCVIAFGEVHHLANFGSKADLKKHALDSQEYPSFGYFSVPILETVLLIDKRKTWYPVSFSTRCAIHSSIGNNHKNGPFL
jgi:hypothetical protein